MIHNENRLRINVSALFEIKPNQSERSKTSYCISQFLTVPETYIKYHTRLKLAV